MGYGIGLVGCGNIAGSWIKAVEQHDQCQIVLTYDLLSEPAAKRAAEAGARAAESLEEFLAADEIDLVIVATPTGSHPELTQQAAAAGKHVLSEKPMALSLGECQQMIDACARGSVKLAIGHTLRFWSAFLKMRQLVAQGVIGVPVSGSIDRMGSADLRRSTDPVVSRGWRDDIANTGGALLEGYIHETDFTRSIFGDPTTGVCQLGGGREYDGLVSPGMVQAVVNFESGAVVTLRTGSTVGMPTMGYWVAGTKGGLRMDGWGGPVRLYRPGSDAPQEVACDPAQAYYLELCDLLQAMESGGEPENSGINGIKNVGLVLGLYHSVETGKRTEFQDGLPVGLPQDYQNRKY
jgi:1,5-anhydro-D-fructose reductase (1,5-anhydro-D-mannitol-forming)